MTNEMKFERSDYYKQKGNEFYKVNAFYLLVIDYMVHFHIHFTCPWNEFFLIVDLDNLIICIIIHLKSNLLELRLAGYNAVYITQKKA